MTQVINSETMETPFDNVLTRLWQQMNSLQGNFQLSELFSSVYAFSRLARVLYINMAEASEKMQLLHSESNRKQSGVALTLEEMREEDDVPLQCRLRYMQFIEEVNRIGRVLKKPLGITPPLYNRVYFFRNKMVEHWDDYLQFLSKGQGLVIYKGKIAIPYDNNGITLPDSGRHRLQQELSDAFANLGVTLPALEGKWYAEYSNVMYTALEQIDGDLRNEKIPKPVVILLFKYCFPTPIGDMEEYCTKLATWLDTLPL